MNTPAMDPYDFLFSNTETLLGVENSTPEERFISYVAGLDERIRTFATLRAKAHSFGVSSDNLSQIKEIYEVGVMRSLKKRLSNNVLANYNIAQAIYQNQTTINLRTSNSIMLQQYSTALPLAYLAGAYVAHGDTENANYFEPSAGNGLLTVALPNQRTIVNEIDRTRRQNLENYGNYMHVSNYDASQPFLDSAKKYNGIITNPPFGSWTPEIVGGYKITKLEHIMSIRALDTMKDNGKAAIIIGGHTKWDKYNKIQGRQDISFFCYLHKHYNVDDTININGQLYGKQGTTFPIRLILISGRKATPNGTAPLRTEHDATVQTFMELWERMKIYFTQNNRERRLRLAQAKAKALLMLLELEEADILRLEKLKLKIVINAENGLGDINEDEYRLLTENAQKAVKYIHKVLAGEKVPAKFEIVLPKWVKHKVKQILGYEIISHKISANGIRHAKRLHGIGGEKVSTQSPALTNADFELFPYILQNPDFIKKGSEKNGRLSIKYIRKLPNSNIIYVESEEWNSHEDFITKTAWKEKSPE